MIPLKPTLTAFPKTAARPKFSKWGSVANYKSGVIPGKTLTEVGATSCKLDWSISPTGSGSILISYTKDGVSGSVYLSSVSRVDFLKEFKKFAFPAGRLGTFTSAESSFCSDLMGMTCSEWFGLFPAPMP